MSFEEKKNLLFSSLETAEQSIPTDSVLHQDTSDPNYSLVCRGKSRVKYIRAERYQGRESIFKRPNASITQCLRRTQIPDYKRNPHRWVKYTLEDTDTSDRTNTAAAFSFLKQMEEQREASRNGAAHDQQSEVGKSLVRFNRSVRLRNQLQEADAPVETPPEDRPQFNGRRVLMPEYVVGQKDPKKAKRSYQRKAPATNGDTAIGLHLDHLAEEDEDDEDGDDREEIMD